ncbi:YggT family protein [Aurantivibrio plasticivorans]
MGTLAQIGLLIIGSLGSLYLAIILLRFMLQLARADFYNPVSQFIVKATNPLLIPLRKVIPGLFGIDIASIVLALAFHFVVILILGLVVGFGIVPIGNAIIWSILGTISMVLYLYFFGMIVMIIASWVAPMSYNPFLMLIRQIVDPITAPFRKIIPAMGGIDITPIFAFLAIQVCRIIVNDLATSARLIPSIVLGFQ